MYIPQYSYKKVDFFQSGDVNPDNVITKEEAHAYIDRGLEMHPTLYKIEAMVCADADYVELKYHFKENTPFNRIRRITGYLVGDLSRFNDGKRAEEHDRVKHDISKEV